MDYEKMAQESARKISQQKLNIDDFLITSGLPCKRLFKRLSEMSDTLKIPIAEMSDELLSQVLSGSQKTQFYADIKHINRYFQHLGIDRRMSDIPYPKAPLPDLYIPSSGWLVNTMLNRVHDAVVSEDIADQNALGDIISLICLVYAGISARQTINVLKQDVNLKKDAEIVFQNHIYDLKRFPLIVNLLSSYQIHDGYLAKDGKRFECNSGKYFLRTVREGADKCSYSYLLKKVKKYFGFDVSDVLFGGNINRFLFSIGIDLENIDTDKVSEQSLMDKVESSLDSDFKMYFRGTTASREKIIEYCQNTFEEMFVTSKLFK